MLQPPELTEAGPDLPDLVRRRRVGLLTAGLAAAAALLATRLPRDVDVSPLQLVAVLALVAVFVVAEVLVLHVEIGVSAHSASLVELPLVLGLFWLDPLVLVAARLTAAVIALAVYRRQSAPKLLFNLSSFFLEVVVALLLFGALGSPGAGDPLLGLWLTVLVASVVSSTLGALAVLTAITLSSGSSAREDLVPLLRSGSAMTVVNATMGLLGVTTLHREPQAAAPMLMLVLALAFAYRGHVRLRTRHDRLNTLYGFVRSVSTASQADGTVHTVLASTCELLSCEVAALTQVLPEQGRGLHLLTHTLGGDGVLTSREHDAEPEDWPLARCISSGEPLLGRRGAHDAAIRSHLKARGVRDCVLVPVPGPAGVAGTLFVGSRRSEHATFEPADVLALEGVASHMAVALQNGRLVDRLTHESRHDLLTGLPNRTEFQARLREELRRPGCTGVLFMDLDRFKDVNDTLGHQAGDQVLCRVAERLEGCLDDGATVARLGGDEYAVVLPGLDVDGALAVAARLRHVLEQPVGIDGVSVDVGVSIGVSAAPLHGDDASVLMRRADVAMYDAKSRSGIAQYDPERDESSTSRLALVAQLRGGLARQEFTLAYQPKIEAASDRAIGFEALLRWHCPQRGTVPPDVFIPLAERAGLLQDITAWVLRTALDAAVTWRTAGHELGVAVNLSPRNLLDPGLAATVRRELAARRLPAERLTLEITEGTIMAEPERAVETLQQLRATGVRLSIDDFGTGYSSLAYLKVLPVDEVKIDKSFVLGLDHDEADMEIVRAVVALSHGLGLEVVAEGVEDEHVRARLVGLRCDVLQGYQISRPMPEASVLGWLERHQAIRREQEQGRREQGQGRREQGQGRREQDAPGTLLPLRARPVG